jgi:hypothetical protein
MSGTLWFLIVFRFGVVPMDSDAACKTAMKQLASSAYCVNTKTGQVIELREALAALNKEKNK